MIPRPETPHEPVLAREVVEHANLRPGMTVVDGTFGAGGHAQLLAGRIADGGTYVAIDRDRTVEPYFARFCDQEPGISTRFVHDNFPHALRALAREGVSADLVILDVGVSSMQIDQPERGFAYSYDAPLDMRMDSSSPTTAADIVNDSSEDEIRAIVRDYGEERFAGRVAAAIVRRRAEQPFARTTDLASVVASAVPAAQRRRGHPAKKTFQALRIAVNDELRMLDQGLDAGLDVLRPGGRLLVIAFHSLEDRMVKRRFNEWARDCICPPEFPVCACDTQPRVRLVTHSAVKASNEEIERNPRASSARLRCCERLAAA